MFSFIHIPLLRSLGHLSGCVSINIPLLAELRHVRRDDSASVQRRIRDTPIRRNSPDISRPRPC